MQRMRFEEEEPREPQYLSEEEADAVIELWAERHKEGERLRSMPTVQQLADSMDISLEEAQALLNEVRSRKRSSQAQTPPVYSRTTTTPLTRTPPVHPVVERQRRRRRLLGKAFFALCLGLFALLFVSFFRINSAHVPDPQVISFHEAPVIAVPSLNDQGSMLEEQAAMLESQAQELEAQVQAQESQINELNAEINRLRGRSDLIAERESVRAVLSGLRAQVSQLRRQATDLRRQAQRMRQSPPVIMPPVPPSPAIPN